MVPTLTMVPTHTRLLLTCDFDSSTCGFDYTTDYDWTRLSGGTPSWGTGPSSDHTSGSGYYMYIEADGNYNTGPFTLLSPTFAECVGEVSFYYHMYNFYVLRLLGLHGHAAARGDDGRRELDDDLDEVGRPGQQLAGRDREHRDGERDPSAVGRDYGMITPLHERHGDRRRGHPERGELERRLYVADTRSDNVADSDGRRRLPSADARSDTTRPTPASERGCRFERHRWCHTRMEHADHGHVVALLRSDKERLVSSCFTAHLRVGGGWGPT